jgi:PadR family transcriptional regulator PadR
MPVPKDLIGASATPLVLSILAEGDSYGYAIIKRVRELSREQMEWTDGMLVHHTLQQLWETKSCLA